MTLITAALLREAIEKNGKPVVFTTTSGAYDVSLIVGGVPEGFPCSLNAIHALLARRCVLAVGASLGNWILPVPERVLESYVVLQLCCYKTENRYGYRECLYSGAAADWLCTTTCSEPCDLLPQLCVDLFTAGVRAQLACMAPSAGVDQILSLADA
jgi:hypothetical protein